MGSGVHGGLKKETGAGNWEGGCPPLGGGGGPGAGGHLSEQNNTKRDLATWRALSIAIWPKD